MHWIAVILLLPYSFILLIIWKNLVKLKQHDSIGNPLFISILIPVRDEEANLPHLLNDLINQDYPPESFEVIIIDDNSNDSSFKIASDFIGLRKLRVIRNPGTGKKSAIRTGVDNSSSRFIITTDADCRLKNRWLSAISSSLEHDQPDMLICPVTLEKRQGFFGRFQELEFLSLQGITAGSALSQHPVMCNGANLAFKKEAYLRNADFMHNEISSGDDVFFLHSLKQEPGAKIIWLESKDAIVTASSSENLNMFLKQRKRWLSKGKAYTDRDTIILSFVTFVTNLLIILLGGISLFNREFVIPFIVAFIIKAIPDFLILLNTVRRYGRKPLLKWFLPSEIIYPFYVIWVAIISFISGGPVNSPSRKGILSSSA